MEHIGATCGASLVYHHGPGAVADLLLFQRALFAVTEACDRGRVANDADCGRVDRGLKQTTKQSPLIMHYAYRYMSCARDTATSRIKQMQFPYLAPQSTLPPAIIPLLLKTRGGAV